MENNENQKVNSSPVFYMGWHKNKNVLLKSSSGGAFTALANLVFEKSGVVVGATKDKGCTRVYHKFAWNRNELEDILLSKYCQSDMGDVYSGVKNCLERGTLVLFSGTACQVAALQLFLGKTDKSKLITVDVLCHGVPSEKVVKSYLKSQHKYFKKDISDFAFRVKDSKRGWYLGGGTRMKITFSDGSFFVPENAYDTFFLGFNNNFFLRDSCYGCRFCGLDRVSDFTLADFWRCDDKRIPQEQMMLGVSLILSNTSVSEYLVGELNDSMEIYKIDPESAVPFNKALREPQNRPAVREEFYRWLNDKDYNHIIQRIFWKKFVKYRIKKALFKFLPETMQK